jgi:hypothetical protein
MLVRGVIWRDSFVGGPLSPVFGVPTFCVGAVSVCFVCCVGGGVVSCVYDESFDCGVSLCTVA